MIEEPLSTWIGSLPHKIRQFSIVFLQLGHAMVDVREALSQTDLALIAGSDFVNGSDSEFAELLLVDDLEQLAKGRGERLGVLRERVMTETSRGRRVALLSRVPKTAYPTTAGSDVVADSKQIFAPPRSQLDDISYTAETLGSDYFVECARELGDRTLIALANALWESQLNPNEALAALRKPDVEALRGAGIVRTTSDGVAWDIGRGYRNFRNAVALASAECASPSPAVPDTFSELWTLERTIRNIFRRALFDRMGAGWRETCLTAALRDDVLERARKDSQPRAERLSDLRDPLEWLTTSELLDLRERHELGALGMESYLWTKLRVEVVPIRNKVAHMRMVNEDDARRIKMWRQILVRRH